MTVYQSLSRYATKDKDIDVYDLSLVRVFVGILLPSIPILYINDKRPFADIVARTSKLMHFRNFIGYFGFSILVYATKFLPIFIL